MKKVSIIVSCLLCAIAVLPVKAQERALHIFRDGVVVQSYTVASIDSIKFGQVIAPPASVNATLNGDNVEVSWSVVSGAASYQVFRSSDNVAYAKLAEGITGTSFIDASPQRGKNYYKVKALGGSLESTFSDASAPVVFNDESIESGLYMGIVGFNQELATKDISILSQNTKSVFGEFVDGLRSKNGTLLYYAVDNAIDMLTSTALPRDIINVSIVTFTDGLDQGSMMMNPNYQTDTEYLNALQSRIQNVKIQGNSIAAYSIGLKGKDVTDETLFKTNLERLASAPENAAQVSNMAEVNAKFQEIADQLVNISMSQTLSLTIPGQSNGTKIRFTFDNVADASLSQLYIEGVFSLQDRSLKEVTYSKGLSSASGSVVTGVQNGIFVTFSFVDLKLDTGEFVPTNKIQQWNYISSSNQWQRNSEFTPENNTETTVERKSAVILLALDCSSSLGDEFSQLKAHAQDFINKLARSTLGTSPSLNQLFVDGCWWFTYSRLGEFAQPYWLQVQQILANEKAEDSQGEELYSAYLGRDTALRFGIGFTCRGKLTNRTFGGTICFDYTLEGEDVVTMWHNGKFAEDGKIYYNTVGIKPIAVPFGTGTADKRTFKLTTDNKQLPSYITLTDQNNPTNVITVLRAFTPDLFNN